MQQSAGTLDLYSMQIRASAFEGESVSVTDLLADSLTLTGSATLDGLTAQGIAIPPGGTEKSRHAVLQTPCEAVPRKVPVTPT